MYVRARCIFITNMIIFFYYNYVQIFTFISLICNVGLREYIYPLLPVVIIYCNRGYVCRIRLFMFIEIQLNSLTVIFYLTKEIIHWILYRLYEFLVHSIFQIQTLYLYQIVLNLNKNTECPSSDAVKQMNDVYIVNLSLCSDVKLIRECSTIPEPPQSLNLQRVSSVKLHPCIT